MHTVIKVTDSNFENYWSTLFANDPLQHPLYAQQNFNRSNHHAETQFTDRSFLVVLEDEPVFGCSLTLHTDTDGRKHVGYFGSEAATHVNRTSIVKPSNSFRPDAIRLLQQHMSQLIEELMPDSLVYLDPVSCGIMSPVSQVLLERGAQPTIQPTQLIDISQTKRMLLRNISKTCRGFIHWGQDNLSSQIISGEDFDQSSSQSLQSLHIVEANSHQDDRDLWLTYEELVRQGSGFLVQSRLAGELVASGLFAFTKNTCHYLAGSTLGGCPDRPVMHSLIWEAMMHSKGIGCTQFNLCDSISQQDQESKYVAHAKAFGGDSHTRLKIKLNQ
jgi:hypothetical protein